MAYPGEEVIIDGEGVDWNYGFGLFGNVSYMRIEGIKIRNFGGYGLTLWGNNRHIEIVNVEVYNCETGLRMTDPYIPGGVVENIIINGCRFHHNSMGVDCSPGPGINVMIVNTNSSYNGREASETWADGSAFESGQNIYVEKCVASFNCGDGFDFKSDTIVLNRCLCHDNARDGI